MKLTPIWKDPAGWIDLFAKTRMRVTLWSICHFVGLIGGLYAFRDAETLFKDVYATQTATLRIISFLGNAVPLIILGGLLPSAYLYVVYRLLKMNRSN